MATVSYIVANLIEQKPFIEDALARGIINYAALAEELLPEIELQMKKKLHASAVMMALRRLAEKLPKRISVPAAKFHESDITIKSDLFEITAANSPTSVKAVQKMYGLVNISKGDFITVTQGLYEITIIANKRYKNSILKILTGEKITKSIDHLSSLTIRISEKAVEEVGLFYVITKALAWENIPITEIVSTFTEQTYVLKEEFVSQAFYAVKRTLESNK
ncbi:MAG: hypothetical protein HY363_01925 [Candidatus Aenigmarchaeota archaeon]|nr:hypothetical protein [Candidatus Aenigmarchaeota archaeon]